MLIAKGFAELQALLHTVIIQLPCQRGVGGAPPAGNAIVFDVLARLRRGVAEVEYVSAL